MPNNTPQPPQSQGTQQGQPMNPEKMLLEFLKEMERNISDLNERVDVLEQQAGQSSVSPMQ